MSGSLQFVKLVNKVFMSKDLAYGIEWLLNAPNYDELCRNAREKVMREFDSEVVAVKYMKLYREMLNDK